MTIRRSVFGGYLLCVCALVIGCSPGEGSSEGMSWYFIKFGLRDGAKPEQVAAASKRISEIPRNVPGVVRHEWGKIEYPKNQDVSHVLLLTVENGEYPTEFFDEMLGDAFNEGFIIRPAVLPNLRDATPDARGSTDGHLRRFKYFGVDKADSGKAEKIEEILRKLPSKITAIERLQWGIMLNDESVSFQQWGVLFTFDGTSARDACLSNPEYKKLDELAGNGWAMEWVASDDWSF